MRPFVVLVMLALSSSVCASGLDILRPVPVMRSSLFDVPEIDGAAQTASTEWKGFEFGHFSFGASLGLMLDPVGFGVNFEGDMWLLPVFSVGSRFTLGVGADTFYLGFAPIAKGVAPLPAFERTLLYAFVGPGFAYVSHTSDGGRTQSEVGFLLTFGTGIDIHFARWFSLGGGISFNWLVTRPADEGFNMMLEFVRFRLHF